MDLGIRNRVALVTGASAGLGAAIALQLAQEGAIVAVAARRRDRLDEMVAACLATGAPAAAAFPFDQGDGASIESLIPSVRERFGNIDIFIANGGGPKPGTYLGVSISDWDKA